MNMENPKDKRQHPTARSGATGSTYLVCCHYEEYCQGYEETWGYFLVTAASFELACKKIKTKLRNAHSFENHTL